MKAVAGGGNHAVALKEDGSVVTWGHETSGSLAVPAGLSGVKAIAAGHAHTVALKEDGTVVAWGSNGFGQTAVPAGLSGVKAIAAGGNHTVALKADGTVVAWGGNGNGQTTVPAGLSGVKAIAAGFFHSLALKENGTVVGWGYVTVPGGLTGVKAIASAVGLKEDGTVVGWGDIAVPVGLSGVKAIASASKHAVVLKTDGTVFAWGFGSGGNYSGQSIVPADMADVTDVEIGNFHTVALKADGSVIAWGHDNFLQTEVPAGLSDVVAVAAGVSHSVALKGNGTVVAWGNDFYGQTTVPAGLADVKAIAAGREHTVALKRNGTVVAWGRNEHNQATVPAGLNQVKAIAAGNRHTVALKEDGTIVAWGDGFYGQTAIPAGLAGVKAIAAEDFYTIALKENGTVVAWGDDGGFGMTTVPTGLAGVKGIAAGSFHAMALKTDGSIVTWGLSVREAPAGLPSANAIAAGHSHSVMVFDASVIDTPEIAVMKGTTNLADGGSAAFGSVNRGAHKTLSFTVKNLGTANLTGIAATFSGGNATDFAVVTAPPATLAPNATAIVSVKFTPAAAGARTTTLRIASSDSNENPFDISLIGSGVNIPEIEILNGTTGLTDGTSTLAYGNVNRGSGKTLSLTIRNKGTANLTGIAAAFSGGNATDFAVVTAPPATLAPNATAIVSVKFTPAAAGARTTTLRIASNDRDENPFDIQLSGSGVNVPEIEILNGTASLTDGTSTLAYGNVNRGSGKTLSLTIRNKGTANLTGIAATFSGGNATDFAVVTAPAATLAPGASAQVSVRFTPAAAGARTTTLRIASSDSNENPFDIRLQGVAVPTPEIAVLRGKANLIDGKSKLNFGSVVSGKQKVISLVIRNTGTAPLTKLAAKITGRQGSQFRIIGKVPTVLKPKKSAVVRIVFRPAKVGRRAASLLIRSNDADEKTFNISLSGAATKAAKTRNRKSATPGDSATGASVSQTNRAGERYLVITIPKDTSPGNIPLVEVSPDRVRWMSGDMFTKTLLDNATTLKVRDRVPTTAADKRHIRVRWLDR